MQIFTFIISSVLLAGTANGITRGLGENPGDWKASPYTLVQNQDGIGKDLRIRNLDLFGKMCHLQVAYQKHQAGNIDIKTHSKYETATQISSPFIDLELILKASRSIQIKLPKELQNLNRDQLLVNMGCISLPDSESTDLKISEGERCQAGASSCNQVCPADRNNIDSCENNHLVVNFERRSWKSEFNSAGAQMFGTFENSSNNDLHCQILTIVKGINTITGDIVFVTAPSPVVTLPAGESRLIKWVVEKSELANSDAIDGSRPRVVGACSPKAIEEDHWTTCQPLKRPECNWVAVK